MVDQIIPAFTLVKAAFDADDAWSEELEAEFGRRAGDVRYTALGFSTPKLAALKKAKLDADEAMRNVLLHMS